MRVSNSYKNRFQNRKFYAYQKLPCHSQKIGLRSTISQENECQSVFQGQGHFILSFQPWVILHVV